MPKKESGVLGFSPVLQYLAKEVGKLVRVDMNQTKGKGKEREIVAFKEYSVEGLPEDSVNFVTAYGLSKLLQDRVSQVDAEDKLEAMDEVFTNLIEGKLKKDRVVGAPIVSVFVEALARVKHCTIPEVQKAMKDLSDEQKDTLKKNPQVVELMAKIKLERESSEAEVSFDDLIS